MVLRDASASKSINLRYGWWKSLLQKKTKITKRIIFEPNLLKSNYNPFGRWDLNGWIALQRDQESIQSERDLRFNGTPATLGKGTRQEQVYQELVLRKSESLTHSVSYLCRYRAAKAAKKNANTNKQISGVTEPAQPHPHISFPQRRSSHPQKTYILLKTPLQKKTPPFRFFS